MTTSRAPTLFPEDTFGQGNQNMALLKYVSGNTQRSSMKKEHNDIATPSTSRVAQRGHAIRRVNSSFLVISARQIFEDLDSMLGTENGKSDPDVVRVGWGLVKLIVSTRQDVFVNGIIVFGSSSSRRVHVRRLVAGLSDVEWALGEEIQNPSGNVSFPEHQDWCVRRVGFGLMGARVFVFNFRPDGPWPRRVYAWSFEWKQLQRDRVYYVDVL
ncbi:hypothetical protein EV421DRAFT_2024759 [Armillaria borealis]|uniref:Uncharacterized protein n=1 Tax=Armillaria borealis TaxID=47425 RepID=A0AA39MEZ1_9AGAR|nr:hypothetical protein EV421DRAFT_2024759 [Armillaria borealis]